MKGYDNMKYFTKILFAVKEDGNIKTLVIREEGKKMGKYYFTYKIGERTMEENFDEEDYDFESPTEYETCIPTDEDLSLFLKGIPSDEVVEILKANEIDFEVVGFLIIEFNHSQSNDERYVIETEIFNNTSGFQNYPLLQAREMISELKDFFSCENDFVYDKNIEIKTLHLENVPIIRGMFYFRSDDGAKKITYGHKNGKIYVRINNAPISLKKFDAEEYYDEYEDDEAEWIDTFDHLKVYNRTINTLSFLNEDEITRMIGILETYKKEAEEQIEEIKKQMNFINTYNT